MSIFSTIFGKDDSKKKEPSLIDQIFSSTSLLEQKSEMLNDSWAEQKGRIKEISAEMRLFTDSNEIAAAKFEQDILGKLTAVSTACDGAISGKQNAKITLDRQLNELVTSVHSRTSIEKRKA